MDGQPPRLMGYYSVFNGSNCDPATLVGNTYDNKNGDKCMEFNLPLGASYYLCAVANCGMPPNRRGK